MATGSPARSRCAAATRHGSRMAASPPGSGIGSSPATRSNEARSQRRSSPPQIVPSVPRPVPSKTSASAGPSSRCSARQAAACAWWCWTSMSGRSCSCAHFVARYSGWRSQATSSGANAEHVEVELEIVDERAIGRLGVEIAEVRREERALARGDAEGGLELRAGGHERPRGRERQRRGREPARPPDGKAAADDRVLAAAVDRPVVREECVGDPARGAGGPRRPRRRSARRRGFRSSSRAGPPKSR